MKIPSDPLSRRDLYDDLVRLCSVSRDQRFTFYQSLRNYYLFGTLTGQAAPYNKIGSTIDTLCSFIYSPAGVRFSLRLGTTADDEDVYKSVQLSHELTDQWRMSGTHSLFGSGLRWSLVFGSMLIKTQWMRTRARSYLVEPHQFGVLREDIMPLADQEAFVHFYTITKTQLYSALEGTPRRERIMQRLEHPTTQQQSLSEGMGRLILSGPVGGVPGSVAVGATNGGGGYVPGGMGGAGPDYSYHPKVDAELVDMCDLYVWNDEEDDYQLVTLAAGDTIVYDRPMAQVGHVRGIPPFTVLRPENTLYDYFFGDSFTARLTLLQDTRTRRLAQIMALLEKQFDPPKSVTGGTGITDERLAALRHAGGIVSFNNPQGKVELHKPDMPPDTFAEIAQIDQMFDDMAGIGHVLQGKGEPGVRSRGQADLMARLGSSRPKERALAAEESAQDIARLMLRLVQDHSKQRFTAELPAGKKLHFLAEQFTTDYEVQVDSHSSSPIFVEDRKHDAATLLEARAIDRETFLEMFDPPNLQELKARLKQIEEREAKQQQMQLAVQAQGGHPQHKGHGHG